MNIRKRLFDVEIALRARAALRDGRGESQSGCTEVLLCIVDHFEPQVGRPAADVSRKRLEDWIERYPGIAGSHRDFSGRIPKHSFFYPWDEFDAWEFERLSAHCADGWGEIELHLHHRDDTDQTLRAKLREALEAYRGFGALSAWPDGRPAFGFIHGNWALDNSRTDGGRNYCGVNNEITILQEEGCFADFTFPSWQEFSQPRTTNSIYYAVDDPLRPKSHDRGIKAKVGRTDASGLPIIQGPLIPSFGIANGRPRFTMDDGDLASYRRYTPERLARWISAGIHVSGRPNRVFIKLHTHGAADANRQALLGEDLDRLFADAESQYNDGSCFRLYHVTAREMFNLVKATEAGIESVEEGRDWILPPPQSATVAVSDRKVGSTTSFRDTTCTPTIERNQG